VSIIIALFGVILGMFGFWLTDQQGQIDYLANVTSSNATRLTAVESSRAEVLDEIRRRLTNIEQELRNDR
jgi:hypothetical protein